jgi:hypothetical protein
MNEKEKREFYVAMCRCCLIATAMKSCPACNFNVGLTEQMKPVDSVSTPISVQIPVFAMAEQC